MPMPPFVVQCHSSGCPAPAEYKIAARWSDGITTELKTYSLCCRACLAMCYRSAIERSERCRLAAGESLESPGVFEYSRERSDRTLRRLPELEAELRQESK